jgi:hypothetical protein
MSLNKRPQQFATAFNAVNMQIQPLQVNPGGQGKTAWVQMKDGNSLFEGPDFRVNFPPKPSIKETEVKSNTKLKLVLQIDTDVKEQADFATKLQEVDNSVLKHFFDKKNQIWPDKARFFTDTGSLMGMFSSLVKEGKLSANGTNYKPSFSLQVPNCSECIERYILDTVTKPDGTKETQVKDVLYKTLIARPNEKPNEKIPKFYLWLGKDDEGNDIVTQKVEVRGKDGKPLLNPDGTKVKRWVGPQDIKAGCMVRPVFRIQKCFLVQTFGVHLVAEAMVIKPAPPKEVADFANVKVVEEHELSERASYVLDSQHEVPEDALPEENNGDDEYPVDEFKSSIPAPDVTTSTLASNETELKSPSSSVSGKKRKASELSSSTKRKISSVLSGDD